jgi:DNA (cytosine-5)-methyltransferase 1
MKMVAFDFFCGAGGLTHGLLDAGIKVLAGFDIDGRCRETFEKNNPRVKFIETDINKVTKADLLKFSGRHDFKDMLFAGCAPCQPFSQQRKKLGGRKDATLLREFGRLIEIALPGQVLMENVPGIARVKGNSTFKRFLKILKTNNYHYSFKVLDAKEYGVPQSRKRLILIAIRGDRASLPQSKYGSSSLAYRTVKQAISHFPMINAGKTHPSVPNHIVASLSDLNLERIKHTPHDGGDRRSWPKRLHLDCHLGNYSGHTDVYGRMAWNQPAPTLTGKCHSISNGRYGHPVQDRAISLREAAALQTFPDGYVFHGSNQHIALQIGNAVPVRFAKSLGKHVLYLRGYFSILPKKHFRRGY